MVLILGNRINTTEQEEYSVEKGQKVYPYIPNSVPEIKAEMLKEVGAIEVSDLYEEIPEDLLFKETLNLPGGMMDEFSVKKHTERILAKNKNCTEYTSFLGAGCASHFVPAVCDEIVGRGEFVCIINLLGIKRYFPFHLYKTGL